VAGMKGGGKKEENEREEREI